MQRTKISAAFFFRHSGPLVRALAATAGLVFLAACSTGPTVKSVAPPGVQTQEEWGGRAYDGEGRIHTIEKITLHHSGETYDGDEPTPAYLRKFQNWCKSEKKWIDIPYHFLIDLDGKVFEGRRIRYAGDTNTEYDPAGHALICILGNYEHQIPNAAQLEAVVSLMTFLARTYGVPPERIQGHRDVADSTVCPGANLYAYLADGYFRENVRRRLAGDRSTP